MRTDNEIYKGINGWTEKDSLTIRFNESDSEFKIIKKSNTEMHLRSIEFPNCVIYLRRETH